MELLAREQIELLSFDIFDTLITRPVKNPTDIFLLMADNSPFVPKDFPRCRVEAEHRARRIAPGGECNINEIYRALSEMEGYTPALCRTLCAMEKETELRLCEPRREGTDLLNAVHDEGLRVLLISDMYLSRQRISRMLCKCGVKNFSELYISNEVRKNKASGDLFRYVRQKEELPFSSMLHVGDNPVSDVIVPRNIGMHALYLPMQEGAELPEQRGFVNRLLPLGSRRRNAVSRLIHRT
jgi:HAD superfamily hydrolase (TIGR01549 family)